MAKALVAQDAATSTHTIVDSQYAPDTVGMKTNGQASPEMPTTEDSKTRAEHAGDGFLVNYKQGIYDIGSFLKHHPGGKVINYFRNRNVAKALVEHPHSKSAFHLLRECLVEGTDEENEIEKLVDWNAPLLWQVGNLKDRYWEWVNLPLNRPIRFFKSDFLENLTRSPWYSVPLVWGPLVLYLMHLGLAGHSANYSGIWLLETTLLLCLGGLSWTILEYILHRMLFHLQPPDHSKFFITFHFLLHGSHHKAPFDRLRLVFPPVPGLAIALLVWHIYAAIYPARVVPFISAGTALAYICYDLTHYYLHHGSPPVDSYLYALKRNHNYHHFSHHNQAFGITSKMWDLVFGTEVTLRKLLQPLEW